MKKYRKILLLCLAPVAAAAFAMGLFWLLTQKPAKKQAAAQPVKVTIEDVTASDGRKPSWQQFQAARSLGSDLNTKEVGELCAFIQAKELPSGVTADRMHALKNDAIRALHRQKAPPADFTRVLLEIYRDKEQHEVMRDYALQHLTPVYVRSSDQEKAQIETAFWSALEEKGTSLPGTALLSLHNLVSEYQAFDSGRIRQEALKMVQDESYGDLARITALQVCGRQKVKEALPLARDLARNAESVPLRISAIAALGNLGDKKDLSFLKTLAKEKNSRLKPAAVAAVERLSKKGITRSS